MKRRIFIGLAPLFVLLIGMGAFAITLFATLGNSIEVILRENFRSVAAGQQMKETAERMDSALFFSLVGEEERGRKMYAQNLPVFRDNLELELKNITVPGEQELADSIKDLHQSYTARAQTFWATSDVTARRTMYFGEMLPTFTKIKDTAQEIIRINQDNMVSADFSARRLSRRSTQYMIIVALIGLAASAYFAHRLQRSILQPIQTLTSVSRELGEGKWDQVVPVGSADELGILADAFNKMAAKLRAYRRAVSDQILQAQQMTEITFSAFPDAIIALAPDAHINFMNPAAERLLRKLELTGALPPVAQAEAEKVLKGESDYLPSSFEKAVCLRIDERETFLLPRVIGMRDDAGGLFGAAVILQDVTRFRLMDQIKSNLVSTVSHELKTPLTSVRMALYLLLEEQIGAINPKQSELLIAARDDSERLLRMINDLLDLAKLESSRPEIHTHITPQALLEKAEREMRDFVKARGIRLITKVEPDLPEVAVDVEQVAHVFSNFLSNAVKHTKLGEEIILQAAPHDSGVRFSVIDSGPGIPPEHQARIFDRFFRVPGTEVSGAGLGLAIAREIVTAQGGMIGVQSQPGQGAEFYFDLPAIRPVT